MVKILLRSVLALLAVSFAAEGDTIYTSQSSWLAAVSGSITTDTFSGVPLPAAPNNHLIYGTGPGATTTLDSVTYTAGPTTNSGDYLGILGTGYAGLIFPVPVLAVGGEPSGPADLLITLPNPVNALGFFVNTDDSTSDKVTLSDGTTSTVEALYPTLGFFGITSSTGLTSVEITNTSNGSPEQGIFLSELQYGPAAPTTASMPEPRTLGSMLLMAVGLVPVARRLRRRTV